MSKFMKNKKIILTIGLILAFIAFFVFIFLSPQKITTIAPPSNLPLLKGEVPEAEEVIKETKPTPKPLSAQNTEKVTVIFGEEKITLSTPANTTFYDALMKAKNSGAITFSGKNYPSLGFFLTDIGALHSGDGKDLLYYINGKEATVGVSSYILKNGDILEWKLE